MFVPMAYGSKKNVVARIVYVPVGGFWRRHERSQLTASQPQPNNSSAEER